MHCFFYFFFYIFFGVVVAVVAVVAVLGYVASFKVQNGATVSHVTVETA